MLKKTLKFLSSSSVNKNQMQLFNSLKGWWHPSGPSQILFTYNYHRIQFLRKHLPLGNVVRPLQGMKVLDVGCGAGFLSESLARLGGNVIGLDPNPTSYTQAKNHKGNKAQLRKLQYKNESLQQFLSVQGNKNTKFDIVTSMQVIEHVNNPQQFLNTISSCTQEGGLIMLSTIRRSAWTWATHILMAEKVLNIVPKGTHHHEKFINPEECSQIMSKSGIETLEILQLELGWKGTFEQKQNGGNYLIMGRKRKDQKTQNESSGV